MEADFEKTEQIIEILSNEAEKLNGINKLKDEIIESSKTLNQSVLDLQDYLRKTVLEIDQSFSHRFNQFSDQTESTIKDRIDVITERINKSEGLIIEDSQKSFSKSEKNQKTIVENLQEINKFIKSESTKSKKRSIFTFILLGISLGESLFIILFLLGIVAI